MASRKYSRQRESIKTFLAGRGDHPTAEIIYLSLREKDPKLSLGTVYRNLALLTELGEIQKISTGEGPEHFDGDVSRHQHFICRRCHRIEDIRIENMSSLKKEAAELSGAEIEDVMVNFYGLCRECREQLGKEE